MLDDISPKEHYIHDKEICAGELNYSENDKRAIIPKPENFISFVNVFNKYVEKKKIYEIAKRPILFIGNLGTTHHGTDKSVPVVEKAYEWKNVIQRFNFVSAVLHGTTNTHSDYLRKSTSGCHKVNVAGDLLETLIKSLPVELYEKIQKSKQEPKKSLFLIKSNMENLSKKNRNKLIINLKHHCDKIQKNINSPRLTNHDISYFKYKPYKFNKNQISEILFSVKNQLDFDFNNLNKNYFSKRKSYFSASMIEVKFDNFYKKAVKSIHNAGIKYFHVDVGDGDFITRKIDAINKVEYLKKYVKNIKIHCHLMVKNPHKYQKNADSYIEMYCKAGCDRIALHERSFKDLNELKVAINLIKKNGAKPGIVIETSRAIDNRLINFLTNNSIDWVVVMGVVIGYGGQIFNNNIFNKIKTLKSHFLNIKKPLLIEVDGGLNDDNIGMCIESGAEILSGWSIVKDTTLERILSKVKTVIKICNNEKI